MGISGLRGSTVLVAIGLVFAASFGGGASSAAADPLHCKSTYMFGTGWALKQSKAKKRARSFWATKVLFKYGGPYHHWQLGRQRQYGCNRKNGGWSCTAFAFPCRV